VTWLLPCLLRARRAVAAVEFALLVPVFTLALAGIVDLGSAVYTWSRLQAALALGANYALVNSGQVSSTSGTTLASAVASLVAKGNGNPPATVTVVVNNGPTATTTGGATPTTSGTAANADSCYCLSGSPTSWTWGSAIACGSTTTCTGSSSTAGKFVTISASYSFSPIFAGYAFSTSGTMTAGSVVQTQ
jgi:Flp pilus assembly protein TadG